MTDSPPAQTKPVLTAEQQSAFDNTLRSGIEQRDAHLIELALKSGADANILMFAGIAYTPSLVKNFADPRDLDAIHDEAVKNLQLAQGKRHQGFKGLLRDLFVFNSNETDEKQEEYEQLKALIAQERKDYNRGLEWVLLAVKFGADVNASKPGEKDPVDGVPHSYPAIHCVFHNFRKDITDFLIANGASVDTPSPAGNTPLMRAVGTGQPSLIRYYLEKGADPMRPCNRYGLPLQRLRDSDKFTTEQKSELLALMLESLQSATPRQAANGDLNTAAVDVGLQQDMEVKKPLSVKKPGQKPALHFRL